MHANSKLLFSKYAVPLFVPGMRVLEIGPDRVPSTYRATVPVEKLQWDTLDVVNSPSLTYPNCEPYRFPIPNDSYDVVLSGQVIEHVARIWRWMPELARVTRPGGLVLTINPVSWPFHEHPIDCWRIYPDGMRALCEDAGLHVEGSRCEALEQPRFQKAFPGKGYEQQRRRTRLLYFLLGMAGLPVEKAFDTITIARKPGLPNPYGG